MEGIEDLQFELGVDNDEDGVAEQYLSSPVAADFENAVAMRVHVLVRSIDEVSGYSNGKSYLLGSKEIDPYNDGYMRKVFTTTVKLRNGLNG